MFPKLGFVILLATSAAISGTEVEVLRKAVTDWLECSLDAEMTNCLEERTVRSLHELNADLTEGLLVQERAGKVLNDSSRETDPLEIENQYLVRKIQDGKTEPRGIIDEIGDLVSSLTFRLLDPLTGTSSEEDKSESEDDQEEDTTPIQERGHKKKELKKKNKQLKLILLLMLLKNKIKMFVNKLQFLVQLKFLLVATINMIANVIRLWIELKKKHKPNKVVYYENAHHQHHYDHEHIHEDHPHYSHPGSYSHHHSHHIDDDDDHHHGGGGIWPWSRAYVEKQGEQVFERLNAYGSRYPGSHSIVYSNQRPLR